MGEGPDQGHLLIARQAGQFAERLNASETRMMAGFAQKVARLAGIEPTTLGFGGQYSIH